MIRVLIADDHPVVREGLKRILNDAPDMHVVGEAGDAEGVLALARRVAADVCVSDLSMPSMQPLELLRALRQLAPRLRLLVISVLPEEQYALHVFRAGAAGYLTKDQTPANLTEAIRLVQGGHMYVSPSAAQLLARAVADGHLELQVPLSRREQQVLLGLAKGMKLREIATELHVSEKTVTTYRSRMLRKLGLKCNADLVRYALKHQLMI